MSRTAWKYHWESSMVHTRILLNMKLAYKCKMTFWSLTTYSDTIHQSHFTPIHNITELCRSLNYEFSMEHCDRCSMPTGGLYSFGHLVLSHWRLGCAPTVEANLYSQTFLNFLCFSFRTSLATFLISLRGIFSILYFIWVHQMNNLVQVCGNLLKLYSAK